MLKPIQLLAITILVLLLGAGLVLGGFKWINSSKNSNKNYKTIIQETAKRYTISAKLIEAIIQRESNFQPLTTGNKGQIGLMQLTPEMITTWEKETNHSHTTNAQLYNPRLNIEIGTYYLKQAQKRWKNYNDSLALTIAQYDVGLKTLQKWQPNKKHKNLQDIQFQTTKEYIITIKNYKKNRN